MNESAQNNLYLITGTDSGEIETAAQKLAVRIAGPNPDPFMCDTIVESDNLPPLEALKQTVASAQSPPFIGDRKTVWLKNTTAFGEEKKSGPWGEVYNQLYAFIENGVPPDICLIMNGPNADRRKKLYKLCKTYGTVKEHEKPDITRRGWDRQMAEIIEQRARDKSMRIEPQAVQYLVQILGSDTARIEPELEKLIAFCNFGEEPLSLNAARQVCQGDGETTAWAIRDAMGDRDLPQVLALTENIIETGRDSSREVLGMIRQTADHFYSMIQILILMRDEKISSPAKLSDRVKNMEPSVKQEWTEQGIEVVNFHPYRIKLMAQQAVKFKGSELVQAIKMLRDLFWQTISESTSSEIAWESLVFKILKGKQS